MKDESYLPLSYLNQLAYCPRRFWYMYVQGELEINAPMLEGTYQHRNRADKPGRETDDQGRAIHRRLWVWSDRLQIAGFADFVESDGETLIPVEYKHGQQGKWDNDHIQLCAQAFCLEEMTGQQVGWGEIFYWRSRRRIQVVFDHALRQMTETAVTHAHHLITTNHIPASIRERQKCQHCSIQPICLPDEVIKLNQGVTLP
ncbi:MAG: CRISPR-associated protein Cas4 [Anaerolineae bacterium]|nr:CRISPR-associated protein Cas4 [Anaerolineae bacterium]